MGAKYRVFDLKQLKKGSTVVVTVQGASANVLLHDSTGYAAYKAGRRTRSVGGLVKRAATARIPVGRTAHWYLTIDMNGLKGNARATYYVEPPALPEYRSPRAPSLPTIRRAPMPVSKTESKSESGSESRADAARDVFISHASEDKEAVARPLRAALETLGISVWFDESELQIGSSLRRRIDEALAQSLFGVVVLSPAFLQKEWPQYELDGLVARALGGEQTLLPIWHGITRAEVQRHSPPLADKLARSTAETTIDAIAEEIAGLVFERRRRAVSGDTRTTSDTGLV